ncbi:hypothetical protein LCGC14_2988780, partial [marine sediment metagenome]
GDKLSRRGKRSTLAVKAFDSIEAAIGGRDAVIGALAAGDLTEDQSYLFGLIADPCNDTRSLASICAKANHTLGSLLQLFKDAKLARAQIEAIAKVTDELPTVAADTMTLAKIRAEPCRPCKGKGQVATDDGVLEAECDACDGKGSHTYTPSIERQKLALELGGLYRGGSGGVQIANVFSPSPPNELGGRITQDYLKNMRTGTDRLLYPGRDAGVDTSEAIDVEVVEGKANDGKKAEQAENPEPTAVAAVAAVATPVLIPAAAIPDAKSESKPNAHVAPAPVPSVDPVRAPGSPVSSGDPFLAPAGKRP